MALKLSELIEDLTDQLRTWGDLEVVADTPTNALIAETLVAYLTRAGDTQRQRVCFLMLDRYACEGEE